MALFTLVWVGSSGETPNTYPRSLSSPSTILVLTRLPLPSTSRVEPRRLSDSTTSSFVLESVATGG